MEKLFERHKQQKLIWEILIHSLKPPHVENSRKFDTRNSLMNSLKHVNII